MADARIRFVQSDRACGMHSFLDDYASIILVYVDYIAHQFDHWNIEL
jgi:hypothetical protein